jgi:hypothetical protein
MAQPDNVAQQQAVQKPKLGRPKKVIDLDLVQKLAHIQCTHTEIASTLNVSVDTLTRNKHFAEVYKRGTEGGRKSLRRLQFESAAKGNVTMQIWLGKQYLDQTDEVRHQISSGLVCIHLPRLPDASNAPGSLGIDRQLIEAGDTEDSIEVTPASEREDNE